mgnify:FL=1
MNRSGSQSTSRAQGGTISNSSRSTSTRSGSISTGGITRGSEQSAMSSSGSGTRSSATTSGSGTTANRGSSSSSSRSGGTTVTKPSGGTTRNSSITKEGGASAKPATELNKGATSTTANGRNYGTAPSSRGYNTADSYNRQTQGPPSNEVRFDGHGQRVHPQQRPFMDWDRPGRFYGGDPHYFGYRVRYLPHYRRVNYWGMDYYFYNDIWYRYSLGHYVICRPPYGISFAYDLYNLELDVIRFAYYNDVYRTYHTINSNYDVILEQNRIIAENNATIAAQNAIIAAQQATPSHIASAPAAEDLNALRSTESYNLATRLGLVQSYAAADQEYYYDDGVFFIKSTGGEYKVIVPPAGALIKALPDDYETITLADNNMYYKVDDTIYRMTVTDGVPYFEVLGQIQENTVVMK